MKKLLVVISAISVAGVASAGIIDTPHVVGAYNGWTNPDAGAAMVETASGSDIWTYTISGLTSGEHQEFKVVNGTGAWSPTVPSANSWYDADASGDVIITYDGNTYSDGWAPSADRIGVNTEPGAWTAVGDSIGWDNANIAATMTPLGGGIYSFTQLDVADGTYYGKATTTGSWNAIGADSRSIDAGNIEYTTLGSQNDVIWTVDAYAGTAKIEVIPEPATLGLIGLFGAGLLFARRKFQI